MSRLLTLITATLAGLYLVFTTVGAEERRVEVARAAPSEPLLGDFSAWLQPAVAAVAAPGRTLPSDRISEGEAIRIALEAGGAHRAERTRDPLRGALVAAVEAAPDPETAEEALSLETWFVTGSTVNIRSGPGTANPVVAQVRLGDAAEVLSESANGWMEIRPAGSETVGWISGRFLEQTNPG